jgi:hypothetical protein
VQFSVSYLTIVKLTKPRQKKKKETKYQQGEVVDNQTVNKTNKYLKKRNKKSPVQEQ